MTDRAPRPKWQQFLADQARQTSTKGGLIFAALAIAGVTLTDQQATTVMAVAGAIAALFNLIAQDRK